MRSPGETEPKEKRPVRNLLFEIHATGRFGSARRGMVVKRMAS